ncbi:thioredoxin [Arcobacter venerupis]|uniref:Thioredoxin n=1 Tax=Arcobacter venerupis TaxID=1054033 RepID=A0AAE7E4N6_9BACT|nr:thioredoxin [Arcobacter venerupis]QKF68110.1 thioredoxin [Arcobacter venerupis]RWS48864.1 thioredoxin [Arcobacter venerupis]
MASYIELNQTNIQETINEGVALVDFWAPWCGPCRMIAPVIEQLAQEFEGKAKICKINTEEEQELTQQYQIRSIPTILFFKNGEIVDQLIGATTKAILEEKLNKYL